MKKQFQSKSVPRGTRTIWRYLGALFLIFILGIGQMWGEDFTINPVNSSNLSPGNIVKVTLGDNLKISSGQIQTSSKSLTGTFTIYTTAPGLYLKSASFTDKNSGKMASFTCTSGGTLDGLNFTASTNATTATFSLEANSSGAAKLGEIAIVVTNGTTNNIVTLSSFSKSDSTITASSVKCNGSTVDAPIAITSSSWTVSSGKISAPSSDNSKTVTISANSGYTLKYVAFNDGTKCQLFITETSTTGGTCDGASWTAANNTTTTSVTFKNGVGAQLTIDKIYVIAESLPKHHVAYALNGGTAETAPTQADVAEGASFTVASAAGITPPTNKKFFKWSDGTNYYAAGDSYTMGTSNVTLTAQWVDDLPDPTATFTGATYIIGSGTLNMSANFESNSTGAVTYSLKEASANASITEAGVFSATAAGEYVVVANQAQVPSTYAAISKEATVTVLDNELMDLFIWKNGTGFGGDGKCVSSSAADGAKNANQNQASTALNYSSSTLTGMTSIGRPSEAGNVTLTFAVTNAYSSLFGIKSICAFGKIEEPAGIEYSWNNTDWTPVAGGESDDKKYEFAAPAGTFPTSLYIRFTNAETGKGGLWLRNALVTLQAKKTVASTVVTLNNVKVNGTAIPAADLSSLLENKSLAISTKYAAAPTVTFVKRTTVNYQGGWAADVTDEEIEVTASDASTLWSASQQIGTNTYAVTLAKPAEPSLVTSATGVTLTSARIATDEQSFTFSGLNLEGNVTISLESAVAGMSVSPAVVTPTAGAITDEEVTITYKSLAAVAETNVNLVVRYNDDVKIVLPVTYSSTVGYEDLVSISAATTWDWNGAASAAVGTVIDKDQMIILANADQTWDENFNAQAIAGKLEYMCRDNKFAQGGELKFNTTVAGKVYVKYSNTGGNAARTVNINGTKGTNSSSNNKEADKVTDAALVSAGDVLIKGVQVSDDEAKYLRVYKVDFLPTHTLSFEEAGEVEPMTVAETEKAVLPEPATVPSGMSFIGWYLGEDKVGDTGDEYTMGTADVELTAKFSAPAETPVIAAQPTGSAYCAGSEPTLTVTVNAVSDGGTLHYAWFKVGEPDAAVGTDAASYTVESAGTYYVKVTNSKAGSADATVTSENAVVTLNAGAEITAQPAALQVVDAGDAVALSVTATNATAYQWYKGGVLIEGAQAATYNFTAAVGAATYYCVVTGACGDVQSNNAVVYVESGDCNTAGYGDGASNVFGTKGSEIALGSYVTYKYSKSPSDFNILVGETSTGVKAHKMDGDFYVWTANTELAAITTSVLTNGTVGGKYCVVFYDVAGYQPDASHIISVVELTAGLKDAAQTFDVVPAPAGAKCARLVRKVVWNETTYGEDSQTYIYAFRACAIVPAEKPVISDGGDLSDLAVCALNTDALTVTVNAVSDGGTLSYQWYNADGDVAIENAVSASYTPTAVGSYYVIVTNTLAGSPSSSTKSATAAVSVKTATAITAYANAAGTVGAAKTLSVTAVGAGLTYQWQACDENGNVTDPAVLGTEATYGVTITAEPQYYLVTVHGDCGNQTQVLFAEEWHEVERANVTGSKTWDWSTAGMGEVALVSGSVEYLMANVSSAVPNTEAFRSDMLLLTGNYANRGSSNRFFQGWQIRFYTEVPGKVSLNCRAIHGTMTITINGTVIDDAKGSDMNNPTTPFFVQPGWVTIVMDNQSSGYVGEAARVQKIVFNATPDYTRPVTEGRYGTICLENGGVMTGATLYEVAYYGETSKKIFFDEILNGTMEAGVPYIYLPNENATQLGVFYTDAAGEDAQSANGLVGYIGESEATEHALPVPVGSYILNNNQYREVVYANSAYILSHRAYINLSAINPSEPALVPGRRRISMSVQSEQVVTGIDALNAGEQPVKMMIDGKLYILRGEKMFDATGRLVK